jgi:VIT1/CCC1 family predicted Fe2+/Mn2+ transporter
MRFFLFSNPNPTETEKDRITRLARVREVVFGAQDGLISTVALVSSVFGAATDNFLIIVAGLAGALGGMISMAAGSFLSSRSQRELYEKEILDAENKLDDDPENRINKLTSLYIEEGLDESDAISISTRLASNHKVFLNTLIEKELGLSPELPGSPFKDALTMGTAFVIAAFVPIMPYFFLQGFSAFVTSVVSTGLALFIVGVGKSRITDRPAIRSGLEILLVGATAGNIGYALGTVVPNLLAVIPSN